MSESRRRPSPIGSIRTWSRWEYKSRIMGHEMSVEGVKL